MGAISIREYLLLNYIIDVIVNIIMFWRWVSIDERWV